jgi:hypothetical protein
MDITIVPLTVNSNDKSKLLPIRDEEEFITPVYWGVYLNDECVSYTSNKELAERTKIWVRNWLSNRA